MRAADRCTVDVGCDDHGICYAEAHGEPMRCPRYRPSLEIILFALKRRRLR